MFLFICLLETAQCFFYSNVFGKSLQRKYGYKQYKVLLNPSILLISYEATYSNKCTLVSVGLVETNVIITCFKESITKNFNTVVMV